MSNEIEQLRKQLERAANTVPYEVQNGSIQLTRQWMNHQRNAVKVLAKKRPTETELLSAINSLCVLT